MSKTIEEILAPSASAKGAIHASPGQRPGKSRPHAFPALKGRPKHRHLTRIQNEIGSFGTPFQGFELFGGIVPRALPWAGMARPVGADKTIEEILAPKPEARPRIYACSIDDPAHAGLLNNGARRSRCFNSRRQRRAVDSCVAGCREAKRPEGRAPSLKQRIAEQLGTGGKR
jgi:hypothetical protein